MDQTLLVEDQINEGRELIEQLIKNGLEVTAACWLKTEDRRWLLYIVSPVVDSDEPVEAYRRAQAAVQQMPQLYWVGHLDFTLIGPSNPIAKGILEFRRRFPGKSPNYYRGDRFGGRNIEGAYIYPLPSAVPGH